jgi:hypothetical protein
MKQGIYKGYNAGCCDGLEVWGVSCDAPSFHSNVGYYNNYHPQKLLSYDCYRITGGGDTHEIKPDLWPRGEVDTWYLYAARVPGTYPVNDSANRPISSKEDGSWGVQLDVAGRREVDIFDDPILDLVTYVNASRAIYVDGQQTYIAYRVSSFQSEFLDQGSLDDNGNYYAVDRDSLHIINIATQTKESYPMDKIGGYPNVLPFPDLDWTPMEQAFASIYHRISTHVSRKSVLHNNQISGVPVLQQLPCNCISIGKDYCVVSNYAPEKEQWAVGRLKYDGMEVHASESYNAGSTYERIGDVTTEGVTFTNNYWIALPSCRVYLDSTVSGSDECWVCAISKDDEADIRIVTGQWFNTTMAPSGSDTDYADGTLADSEVANTILDTSEFPGVEFPNLQIRCYNRVWDPTFTDEDHPNGQCRDLLIFTTQADEDYPETPDDIEATFEGGDLNTGLEDADIEFTTGGSVDLAGWFSNGSTTYSSDSPITGSYSAKTNPIQVDVIQKLVLAITFNKTTAGYVTFNYRHHNRLWGEPGSGIGTFLSNYNVPENYLDIRLDGSLITSDQLIDEDGAATVGNYIAEVKNNGVDWVALPTTRLDNGPITNSPENCTGDDTKFTRAREVRIWVKAGTHTLSFSHNRGSDGENEGSFAHLYSQVDDLNLGKLMVGGDPTNKTAWIYNGQMVQLAQWWAWPRREEEEALDLDDRISTSPDFITMDKKGRILYGNPHGVVRLKPSGDDDGLFVLDEDFGGSGGDGFSGGGGYVRFTASPLLVPRGSVYNCDDAPPEGVLMDVIADPPWGSFQILPFGTDGDFQVRGANASLRDATEYPF